ncbi:MAG TPA: murein biosynthesis integral membrane protein MurJ [Patescibacteria group bacterium]|nr:murein biosynthesis integral membrane protein MurJ [Patescibacteria group bacterium]
MIKKLFPPLLSVTGAALVLGLASFASRLIGIGRDRIFAHYFGAGDILDTYYAAFRIPDLVYNLIVVGALSSGFIPVFVELSLRDKQKAWKITSAIINILGLILVIICGLLWIFTPQIMPYLVPGFGAEKIAQTILLTRIMYLSPIILGISGIVNGVIQAKRNFFIYSLTPILYNLGIIIGTIFLFPIFGLAGLAYGVILGAVLHLLTQIPTLYQHGYHYRPILLWRDRDVHTIFRLTIPRALSMGVSQINLIVTTTLASTLALGSVAIFNLASNLQAFPVSIIGISFAVAVFPILTESFAEKHLDNLAAQISATIRQVLFFISPLTIIFLLLRAQIVRVVLGSGEFDWQDTITTADTLAFFTLSLFAQCLIHLLARGFYAIRDTKTPFYIAIIAAIVNISSAIYLKNILGVPGLALAFTISAIFQMAMLWFMLRLKIHTLNESLILSSLLKISLASLLMAAIVQFLKTPLASLVDMTKFWGIFSQGAVAGLTGLLAYFLILHWLRLDELQQLIASFRRRFLRITGLEPEANKVN